MKRIILFISIIISHSLLTAKSIPPSYRIGSTPEKTGSVEYLAVKAPPVMCGKFSIQVRDRNNPRFSNNPTKTWQHIFEQNQEPNLIGLQLKAYRVLENGTFQEKGGKFLVTTSRSGLDAFQGSEEFLQFYDDAGEKNGDHYRIYCVKTYGGKSPQAPGYKEEYINCSDVIFYDVIDTEIPNCRYKKEGFDPLGLARDWPK